MKNEDRTHSRKEITRKQFGEIVNGSFRRIWARELVRRGVSSSVVPSTLLKNMKARKFSALAVEPDTSEVAGSGAGGNLGSTFLAFVAFPTIAAMLYFCFIASDIYVAEARVTVRESSTKGEISSSTSLLSKLGVSNSAGTAQDSMIVLDYLKSRAAVGDVGGRELMGKMYDRTGIDWFSRLNSSRQFEEIWTYWKKRVLVSLDSPSGIITIRVNGFSAADALDLTNRIVHQSEELLNRISYRTREDSLRRAKDDVDHSASELATTRSDLLEFQQRSGSIDPIQRAKSLTTLVSTLTLQKIQIESELATAVAVGATERPGDRQLKAKLDATSEQIMKLNSLLTNQADSNAVASQLKEFELLKLRQEFSEQIYTLSRAAYETARRRLEQQQLYLAVVVPATLPEKALYPQAGVNSALVFGACFILWSIGSLVLASIRDSVA